MRLPRALTSFAAAAARAVFALTLLLAAGAQAVVAGGHIEPEWGVHVSDGRVAAVHPVPAQADTHGAAAHVQCAVCRVLAMGGREGPPPPSAPPPHAAALAAPLFAAAAGADLPGVRLAFRSRAPPL
ncbi:MAG: hypothetical protein KJS97_09085 [Alphaproteobacteria bacterium]|nr:hypothetical protein [Alphaproteobacteria bacterium]